MVSLREITVDDNPNISATLFLSSLTTNKTKYLSSLDKLIKIIDTRLLNEDKRSDKNKDFKTIQVIEWKIN